MSPASKTAAPTPGTRPPASPKSSRGTLLKVLIGFALLNTLVIIGVGIVGHKALTSLEKKTARVQPFLDVFSSPKAPEEAVQKVGDLLRASVGDFILGASNGQISAFIASVLMHDWSSLGFDAQVWAMQLERSMKNTTCKRSKVECPGDYNMYPPNSNNYPMVSCPGSSYSQQCYNAGQTVTCNDEVCAFEVARQLGSYVESIGGKLQQLPSFPGAPDMYPPAFSNGLFQIDGWMHWIQNQLKLDGWKAAGTSCNALRAHIKGIDWAGTYIDENKQVQSWNITRDFHRIADDAEQWCVGLMNLPASSP